MRLAILLLLSILPAFATSITIKDPTGTQENEAQQIVQAINVWRLTQLDDQGNLKYPTSDALAKEFLRAKIVDVLNIVCPMTGDRSNCPPVIKVELDAAETSNASAATVIEDLVSVQ